MAGQQSLDMGRTPQAVYARIKRPTYRSRGGLAHIISYSRSVDSYMRQLIASVIQGVVSRDLSVCRMELTDKQFRSSSETCGSWAD